MMAEELRKALNYSLNELYKGRRELIFTRPVVPRLILRLILNAYERCKDPAVLFTGICTDNYEEVIAIKNLISEIRSNYMGRIHVSRSLDKMREKNLLSVDENKLFLFPTKELWMLADKLGVELPEDVVCILINYFKSGKDKEIRSRVTKEAMKRMYDQMKAKALIG